MKKLFILTVAFMFVSGVYSLAYTGNGNRKGKRSGTCTKTSTSQRLQKKDGTGSKYQNKSSKGKNGSFACSGTKQKIQKKDGTGTGNQNKGSKGNKVICTKKSSVLTKK